MTLSCMYLEVFGNRESGSSRIDHLIHLVLQCEKADEGLVFACTGHILIVKGS
jgi:hypothetical protein